MKRHWNGHIPKRRYAIFNDLICGNYAIVVTGNDIDTAEKWGGFVCWLGNIRPEETRKIN